MFGAKPESFWHLALPVLTGQLGAAGAAWLAGQTMQDASKERRAMTSTIVGISAFWLFAGLAWTAMNTD